MHIVLIEVALESDLVSLKNNNYWRGTPMKTLIVFASTHGTTEKAVSLLSQHLSDDVKVIDLKKEQCSNLDDFDTVIIGGSIHIGMFQRKVTKFINVYDEALMSKKIGLFLCCMKEDDDAQAQFETAYPPRLRKQAVAQSIFGGELLISKMNFFERKIIKKVSGTVTDVSSLNEVAIKEFADIINELQLLKQ